MNLLFPSYMKIVHIADTHIGYSRYNRIDPETGLNVREKDVYDAFESAVQMILDINPDVVVHAGDLFDSVRPTNRALSVGIKGILQIAETGIEVVIISGNHSTPRLRETGSPFRLLEKEIIKGDAAARVHPVFKGAYEKVEIGGVVFHAIPHMEPDKFGEAARSVKAEQGMKNVAVMHAGYVGISAFRNSDENNEILLKSSDLVRKGMDYIALGHYHEYSKVEENVYYSGSTERLSYSEVGQKKGFIELDLDSGHVKFHEVRTRPMFLLKPIDAKTLGPSELLDEIRHRVEERDINDAMVKLRIGNVGREVWQNMDRREIARLTSSALNFVIEPKFLKTGTGGTETDARFRGFVREFDEFYGKTPIERLDRERLKKVAMKYLHEVVSE